MPAVAMDSFFDFAAASGENDESLSLSNAYKSYANQAHSSMPARPNEWTSTQSIPGGFPSAMDKHELSSATTPNKPTWRTIDWASVAQSDCSSSTVSDLSSRSCSPLSTSNSLTNGPAPRDDAMDVSRDGISHFAVNPAGPPSPTPLSTTFAVTSISKTGHADDESAPRRSDRIRHSHGSLPALPYVYNTAPLRAPQPSHNPYFAGICYLGAYRDATPSDDTTRWACAYPACATKTFGREADLQRHMESVHNKLTHIDLNDLDEPRRRWCRRCMKAFTRYDARSRHERETCKLRPGYIPKPRAPRKKKAASNATSAKSDLLNC